LFEAKAYPFVLGAYLKNLGRDLLSDRNHITGVIYLFRSHLGHVDEAGHASPKLHKRPKAFGRDDLAARRVPDAVFVLDTIPRAFLNEGSAGEAQIPVPAHLKKLHTDAIPRLAVVGHVLDVAVAEFGDVEQPNALGQDLHKRPVVLDGLYFTFVDLALVNLGAGGLSV
jgi:hypothetical protein